MLGIFLESSNALLEACYVLLPVRLLCPSLVSFRCCLCCRSRMQSDERDETVLSLTQNLRNLFQDLAIRYSIERPLKVLGAAACPFPGGGGGVASLA